MQNFECVNQTFKLYEYTTDIAILQHTTAGQKPLRTTSSFLNPGPKWTIGCAYTVNRYLKL